MPALAHTPESLLRNMMQSWLWLLELHHEEETIVPLQRAYLLNWLETGEAILRLLASERREP